GRLHRVGEGVDRRGVERRIAVRVGQRRRRQQRVAATHEVHVAGDHPVDGRRTGEQLGAEAVVGTENGEGDGGDEQLLVAGGHHRGPRRERGDRGAVGGDD